MKLRDIQDNLEKLSLNKEQSSGILNLIDTKIENDMKEVLNKIDNKFDSFASELKRIEDKQDTRYTLLIWAIGILMALIVGLKFLAK